MMNSKCKINSSDYFFNHQYLNKVKQRNTNTSKKVFANFFQRNNEYRERKELKLQERIDKLAADIPFPVKQIENPRSLEQFNEDQTRFLAFKEENMKRRKEDQEALETFTAIPEISKKSREIALVNSDDKDVYTRLFQERDKKKKMSILAPNTDKKEKKPMTKDELTKTVTALFNDAKDRKNQRTKSMEINMPEVELTTKSCKTVLINSLLNDFKSAVEFDFDTPNLITLTEYTNILKSLGFIKHQDETAKKHLKEKEDIIINDSWNILEGSRDGPEGKIDTNQLFVFCACVTGLYKGEKEKTESIFKTILPGSDLSNHYYPSRTAKQMKILFRYFYENRVDFLMERKKLARLSKTQKGETKSTLRSSAKKTAAWSNYRRRVMNEINGGNMETKLSDYLHAHQQKRKKTDRYISLIFRENEKLRTIKEDEELKYCTFQPNQDIRLLNKDSKEISLRLFADAQTKQQTQLETQKVEEQFSFKPTINHLYKFFNTAILLSLD
jgi:hypothetical protein